jgi:hypothetical protein
MKKHKPRTTNARKVEGEGSYTAARSYDKNVRSFAAQGNDVQRFADDARRALEGSEGAELRQAERVGKSGNTPKPRTPTRR